MGRLVLCRSVLLVRSVVWVVLDLVWFKEKVVVGVLVGLLV